MPVLSTEIFNNKQNTIAALRRNRYSWWRHWRDVANYIMPRRYVWLETERERLNDDDRRNKFILDGTGTQAARTLAAGMMNGVTSPGRPWFRLRVPGAEEDSGGAVDLWLDEVQRRMLLVMAESNFYNALAVLYLDLVVFGTSSMLIYEDFEDVIRCYNSALGEYYIAQDSRLQVNTFAREFNQTVHQAVTRWGLENCSQTTRENWNKGGEALQHSVKVFHLIEPNNPPMKGVSERFAYREFYWEQSASAQPGLFLSVRGFNELPGVFPRWEIVGNEPYGYSPGMDALPDIVQLQHETKAKAKGLDYMNEPPLLADAQLRNNPKSLLPRGITYVAGLNSGASGGARPVYQVNPPIQELALDIQDVRQRIREIFHNDLFKMISQLDTVRSATEIDARREEKLVLLGPVLERFENEALDPAITRVFNIMMRKDLLPEPPPELSDTALEIQYVSILSDAQRAVGTAAHERWAQFVGNLAAVEPKVLMVPDWEGLVRDYGERIGVPGVGISSKEAVAEKIAGLEQKQALAETAQIADPVTRATKQLSETDVGGGENALQQLLG